MKHSTVFDSKFLLAQSDFQIDSSINLDKFKMDFDQNIINEIVLWKVNRYSEVDPETIKKITSIDPDEKDINIILTQEILSRLLKTKGVKLPMASTILRFRNPHIYQIIDQRVFRIIYPNQKLKIKYLHNDNSILNETILYFQYLIDLRKATVLLGIPFDKADSILYKADKRINANININW